MSYLVMGAGFAAIGFVVASLLLSFAVALAWRGVRARPHRAGTLFLLRMTPAIGTVVFVLGVVVPAFVAFEPRDAGEQAGLGLVLLAAVAAALVLAGAYRAAASWLVTRKLERTWRRVAQPADFPGLRLPGYRVPSSLPFAALVGIVRPRLFVSDRFFDALSGEERRAVLQHEAGHLAAFDNVKRAAIRLAPDWLGFTRTGREIEAAWANAAEEAADDHAARSGEGLAVAGALLKASRFGSARLAPVSNFCDGATIARRVARLLEDPPAPAGRATDAIVDAASIAALAAGVVLASWKALPVTYATLETVVRLLP